MKTATEVNETLLMIIRTAHDEIDRTGIPRTDPDGALLSLFDRTNLMVRLMAQLGYRVDEDDDTPTQH